MNHAREVAELLKKSIENLNREKYPACIRNIQILQNKPKHHSQELNTFNKHVSEIIPAINCKIHM